MPDITISADIKIHYETRGSGPAIFIIPQPVRSSVVYEPFLALRDQYTVVTHDRRIDDKSLAYHARTRHITVDEFASDIEAVRLELNFRRIVLIAHSAAGWAAVRYATHHPDSVAGVTLVSASNRQFEMVPEYINRNLHSEQHKRVAIRLSKEIDIPLAILRHAVAQFGDPNAAYMSLNDKRLFELDALKEIYAQALSADERRNYTPEFKNSVVPTTLILGELEVDRRSDEELISTYALPKTTQIHIVREAGHFTWLESDEVLRIIRQNIARNYRFK